MKPTALFAAMVLCAPLAAQELAQRKLEARVTAVSGASVYLDLGRDVGVEPGDRARVLPVGGTPIELVVRAVSRQSARCEPAGALNGLAGLEVGAAVDVFVPESRVTAKSGESAQHPQWTHPTENWSADMPLLAPAQARASAQRESRISGRWYSAFDGTWENVSDSQDYWLGRTGLELDYDNAFGRGDSLRFDGELFTRNADVGDGQNDDETRARIERMSWRVGGTREQARRLEVGRFLHSEMPQLGVLDGVEVVQRLANGDRVGASVGYLPEWTPEMTTGEDAQVSLFYRHVAGLDERFSLAGAVQKTWHQGESDRDLFVSELSWLPNERLSLYASAWVDFYGSDDAPKSSSAEVTEAHASGTYRYSVNGGIGLSFASIRWPVLLRNELPPVTQSTLADGEVQRLSANTWRNLTKNGRLYARLDSWSSDTDSGTGGEVSYGQRNWLWNSGEVGAALLASDGEYSALVGGRLWANKSAPSGFWTLAYELANHEQSGFNGAQSELLQQAVRASWDGEVGDGWDLSVGLDQRFGDEQGSTSLGLWLQRRW